MHTNDILSTLVNADRVRSSIRRLFTGEISEILGELLQNSQRARATDVTISNDAAGFTYADNGHGLLGGVSGFHTLLTIAESDFDNPTIDDQNPMGLGIHALLAHEHISTVRFESDTLALTIDTARWWADQTYYSTWFERLETLTTPVGGLRVVVQCAPTLRELMQTIVLDRATHTNPARGYADLLRITLDGIAVNTSLPGWVSAGEKLVETTYQGCQLTIRYNRETYQARGAVNWYGQVIRDEIGTHFSYYLNVHDGRPVNPMSPSRRGLIEDAARAALIAFINDELFAFLFDPANRTRIKPEWVVAYAMFDHDRALREAPYFVAAPLELPDIGSIEDLDTHGDAQIFAYGEEQPRLLEAGVMAGVPTIQYAHDTAMQGEPEFQYHMYGRDAFLPMLGAAYTLKCGNSERLMTGTIYWKPGPKLADVFNVPGEWGIGDDGQEPTIWQPVTAATVFAFNDPDSWDVDSVKFIVGTTNPLGFYQTEAWAGFDPQNDDYDYDQIQESYAASCMAHIRALIGDAIPADFDIFDIQANMQTKEARITSIRYHYPRHSKAQRHVKPIAITARNSAGEKKRLKLVA
jgi:hypothetical protein